MTTKLTLNKADIVAVLKALNEYDVDHFQLIYEDASGIGYTLSIEYKVGEKSRMTVEVVGTENW